ncbi:MAG: response regulator [Clostridia bacterium]|nr:response regulator [Clostridia bacterium]
MLKLLIIEDERWEREGLVDFLDWGSLGIEIAGCACDGKEGIEMAASIRPDIIITDIKMPGMDGITMSKKIKEFLPEVKMIILTGYDDFRFAREAITFNANGYLLKPVEEEEMLELIKKITRSCEAEKHRLTYETDLLKQISDQKNIVKDKILLDLYEGKLMDKDHLKVLNILNPATGVKAYAAVGVRLIPEYEAESDCNEKLTLKRNLNKEEIEQSLDKDSYVLKLNDDMEDECFIYLSLINGQYDLDEAVGKIKEYFGKSPDLNAVIGIGESVESLYNIRTSCLQARTAMEFGVFWDSPGVFYINEVEKLQRDFVGSSGEFLMRGNYYSKQIIFSIRSANVERIHELMREMFSFISTNKGATRDFICNYIYGLINEAALLLFGMNEDIENIYENISDLGKQVLMLKSFSHMQRFMLRFYERIIVYLLDKRNNKDEHIVKKVIQLVEKKYMMDINLKTIAAEVFLSPNYLGSVFKKGMGKAFNDYLTEYRMEKAKDLLKSPKNKVSWVAQAVGMSNTSYFCVVFKSTYGMAPGEYQEMLTLTSTDEHSSN